MEQQQMVRISVEVKSGTARFRVGVQAPSIREALGVVGGRYPRGVVGVAFPIEPEEFFVYEQTQKEAACEDLRKETEERIMIRYTNIEEQLDYDFTRARRRAFVRRMQARIFGDPASTLMRSFEDVSNEFRAFNRIRLGTRMVAVEKIVGSVGRSRDFDRTFLPTHGSLQTKWKRVDRAYHRGQELPPVVLFKLGEAYFVEDGNHRVSVARYQGVEWIDAEVTVLHNGASAAPVQKSGTEQMKKERAVAPQPVAA